MSKSAEQSKKGSPKSKKREKLCKRCGNPFTPYSTIQKHCSPKCEKKAKEEKEKEKRKVAREKKAVSIKSLTLKADLLFGRYIRYRDAEKYGCCVTCKEPKAFEELQCGHLVSRAYKQVRWDETNASGQCPKCNCWGGGRQWEHGKEIDKRWGEGTAESLFLKSTKPYRLTTTILQDHIAHFSEMLKKYES